MRASRNVSITDRPAAVRPASPSRAWAAVVGPRHARVRVEHEQPDREQVQQRVVRRDARWRCVAVMQLGPERVDLVPAAAHRHQRGQEREGEPGDRDRHEGVHEARIAHAAADRDTAPVPGTGRSRRQRARRTSGPAARLVLVDPVAAANGATRPA